ncbi:MAG: FkbM family methyltransferase [Acetobacteraceae bacterium]
MDAPDISFEPVDSMIMEAVYWCGIQGYEGIVSDLWERLCRRSRSILEIGGNVGIFTVIGGKVAPGKYTVVEPVAEVASILRQNLHRNDIRNVEVVEGAAIASDIFSDVTLTIPREQHAVPVGAGLVEGSEIRGRTIAGTVRVRGIPIRSLVTGRDLIKIDAEGIEAALLTASQDIIRAARPTLVVEVLPQATGLGKYLAALAEEVGYNIAVIPEWGTETLVPVDARVFSSGVPASYRSKDVVLSTQPL